jgi:hypothetical protein
MPTFSIEEFIARLPTRVIADQQRAAITTMLDAIRELPVGKPAAASYSRRGVEQRRMELTVHPVIFYNEGSDDPA